MPSTAADGLTPTQCTATFAGVPDEFPSSIEPSVIYRGFSGMNQAVACTAGANGYPYNWFSGRVTLPIEFSYSFAPGVWYSNGPTIFDIELRWTGLDVLEVNYANLSGVVHDAGGWCAAPVRVAADAGPFNMVTSNPQNIPGFPAWPTPIPAGAVTISAWA